MADDCYLLQSCSSTNPFYNTYMDTYYVIIDENMKYHEVPITKGFNTIDFSLSFSKKAKTYFNGGIYIFKYPTIFTYGKGRYLCKCTLPITNTDIKIAEDNNKSYLVTNMIDVQEIYDLSEVETYTKNNIEPSLIFASKNDFVKVVEYIISRDNLRAFDFVNNDILEHIYTSDSLETLRYLINKFNFDIKDIVRSMTFLYLTISDSNKIKDFLIEKGVDEKSQIHI